MSDRFLTPCIGKRSSGYVPPQPPQPIVTYRILSETGAVLNTETANKLRTEQVQ